MEEELERAPAGYLAFSDAGTIVSVNRTLAGWLGLEAGRLLGARVESIFTMASRIFYQTHLFPLLALHGKAEEIFLSLQGKGGETLPMLAYAERREGVSRCIVVPVHQRQIYESEILEAKRTAEAALASNEEFREARGRLQEQAAELDRRRLRAEQKNRELLQVTDILFHDLREPIRKIETFGDLLSREMAEETEGQLALGKVMSAALRMKLLLAALQEFVSVETVEEPLVEVDLAEVAAAGFASAHRRHPGAGVRYDGAGLPVVHGYARQLELLFERLFDNSFRFGREGIPLEVRVEGTVIRENAFRASPGQYRYVESAQVLVKDNGIGIAPEYRESVFDLLKTLDARTGLPGCGLAVVRKVAENHFGTVSVVAQEGPGTTFRILLPVRQE